MKKIKISKTQWQALGNISRLTTKIAQSELPMDNNADNVESIDQPDTLKKARESVMAFPFVILSGSIMSGNMSEKIKQIAESIDANYTKIDLTSGIMGSSLMIDARTRFDTTLSKILNASNSIVDVGYSMSDLNTTFAHMLAIFIAQNQNTLQSNNTTIVGSISSGTKLPYELKSKAMVVQID